MCFQKNFSNKFDLFWTSSLFFACDKHSSLKLTLDHKNVLQQRKRLHDIQLNDNEQNALDNKTNKIV
jgi:hypothetical protein